MQIPTNIFQVMTLLSSIEDSDSPSVINPQLTITETKKIMIDGLKDRTGDFQNTGRDILSLTNALSVIYGRKPRGIRPEVRKALYTI